MIQAKALADKFRYALDNKWGYIWGTAGVLWTKGRQNNLVQSFVNQYGTSWQKNSEARNNSKYNSAVSGSKWEGHYVADCSGLFKWAFNQLGGSIAHGSNSIWDRYTKSKGKLAEGKRTDGKDLLIGTAVFTGTDSAKPHIGLYAGSGKVIEAANTSAGVVTSNITATKWKYWGELKNVEYESSGADQAPAPAKDELPTLRRGSKGTYVTKLQTALKQKGYSLGPCGIDGDFGKATEAAVKQFQRDWGLDVDGVCGPDTWRMILSTPAKATTYTVTIPGLTREQAQKLCSEYKGSGMKEE